MDLIYLLIYNRYINFFLRWINKGFAAIMPLNIRIPPSGVITLKSGDRRFKLATNQTSYLTQVLFWHGISSFEYSPIFRSLIKKTGVFFDIGSNIGYYSILACAENTNINVYSFEPAEGAWHYLKKNVALNDIENQVRVEKFAISDKSEILTFHEVRNDKYNYTRHVLSGESNASTKELDREFNTYRVPGITLDEYCERNAVPEIDLIKIDTEGSEHRILLGGKKMISKYLPIIICEILFDFNEDKIEAIMNEFGYGFYLYKGGRLMKTETLARSDDDGVRDCFFVHPDKYPLIEEYVT